MHLLPRSRARNERAKPVQSGVQIKRADCQSIMEPSANIGDVKIYRKDASTLRPGCWLGDQAIAYLFESLARGASKAGASLVLLEPSLTFTAAMVGDAGALREMLSVPHGGGTVSLLQQLEAAELVLMPVNNNDDASALEGGGHWSLLIFRRRGTADAKPRFEHYDSCGHANGSVAKSIAIALAPLLMATKAPRMQLVSMETPNQANGYDCGVYVLAIAEIVCAAPPEELGHAPSDGVTAAVRGLKPADVTAKRQAWHDELTAAVTEGHREE